MHQSGWVHRDISAGNIIVVDGTGRLTDLEYALNESHTDEVGRTVCHGAQNIDTTDWQTIVQGTPYFVAVEVDRKSYQFMPPAKLITRPDMSAPVHSRQDFEEYEFHQFRYNPLHDLESLWWISVYFSFHSMLSPGKRKTTSHGTEAQRIALAKYFYNFSNRYDALEIQGIFANSLRCLYPTLRTLAQILEDLRILLRTAYVDAEKSIDLLNFNVAAEYYDRLSSYLQEAAEYSGEKRVKTWPIGNSDLPY